MTVELYRNVTCKGPYVALYGPLKGPIYGSIGLFQGLYTNVYRALKAYVRRYNSVWPLYSVT